MKICKKQKEMPNTLLCRTEPWQKQKPRVGHLYSPGYFTTRTLTVPSTARIRSTISCVTFVSRSNSVYA